MTSPRRPPEGGADQSELEQVLLGVAERAARAAGAELVIDAVIQPEDLRSELIRRFALAAGKHREWPEKRNPVTPV